ncbi:MAG: site-2 protease family protein [Candidatus Coproplasma sp.]
MKVKIHPLFFLALIFCAVFGGLPLLLICLVTALLHECGHIFCAERLGFKCEEIKIMPYGASAVCDIEGIRAKDEIILALAGPFVNACICVVLAGLWWFFPISYAYTDTAMYANLAMLIVNLLPAYPLDGGRVVGCVLTKFLGKRKSEIVLKISAVICAIALVVGFFFTRYNISLPVFAVFLLFSAIEKKPSAIRIDFSSKVKKTGKEIKYVLCNRDVTFLQAYKMLDDRRYLVLQLYNNGEIADEITQDELYSLSVRHSIYDKVFEESDLSEDADYFSRNESLNSSSQGLPSANPVTHSTPKDMALSATSDSEA